MATFDYEYEHRCKVTGVTLWTFYGQVMVEHEPGYGFTICEVLAPADDGKPVSLSGVPGDARQIADIVMAGADADLGNSRSCLYERVTDHFNDQYASTAYDREASRADYLNDMRREAAI
jgi:hypothetical protein